MLGRRDPRLEGIWSRIVNLRKKHRSSENPIGSNNGWEDYSNCHGTTLYLHKGISVRNNCPDFIKPEYMKEFLESECSEVEREDSIGGIVTFSRVDKVLGHSATVIKLKKGDEKIFHQAGSGSCYGFSTRKRYINNYFGLYSPDRQEILVKYYQTRT